MRRACGRRERDKQEELKEGWREWLQKREGAQHNPGI